MRITLHQIASLVTLILAGACLVAGWFTPAAICGVAWLLNAAWPYVASLRQ